MIQLGLIGKNGAGKSSVCTFLVSKEFLAISLSDIVREEATKAGLELTRENLIHTANRLKSEHSPHYLAEESYKKSSNTSQPIVFDSIRNKEEALYLQTQGVHLIGIDAPLELRYKRIQLRAHQTDFVDFETFKLQDELENSGKSSGQNISAAFKFCETIINNEADVTHLHSQIESLLRKVSHATT